MRGTSAGCRIFDALSWPLVLLLLADATERVPPQDKTYAFLNGRLCSGKNGELLPQMP